MQKLKLYVGCALKHATPEFVASVTTLKDSLRDNYDVLDFVGLGTSTTPQDIFNYDRKQVTECDVFLAICDEVSTGLGVELGIATELKKPTLAVAHTDAIISGMVEGNTEPTFSFKRYSALTEIPELLKNFTN